MTFSFYIRHGMTEDLARGVFCGGDADTELSKEGYKGVLQMAEALIPSLENIDRIYCSPLKRSIETACVFEKLLGKKTYILENLREWRLGKWEGKPWQTLPPIFTNENTPPYGEDRQLFRTRAIRTFEDITNRDERCLIVGHAVFFYELTKQINGSGRILDHSEIAMFTHKKSGSINLDVIPANNIANHFKPSNK